MKTRKMTENAFTDKALDSISDYIAMQKMSNKKTNFFECVNYVSDQLRYSIPKIVRVFGDLIKEEIDRANSIENEIDESIETFTKTILLKEDENAEITKQVGASEKSTQKSDIDTDERNKSDKSVRKYFLYMNLEEGKIYICGKTEDTDGIVNKALTKLNSFLDRCITPVLKNGILVAPITYELAKKYLDKFKGAAKYLDITPKKQENTEQK